MCLKLCELVDKGPDDKNQTQESKDDVERETYAGRVKSLKAEFHLVLFGIHQVAELGVVWVHVHSVVRGV